MINASLIRNSQDTRERIHSGNASMSATLDVMRDHPLPIEVNSLSVDDDGTLKPADPLARPVAFSFKFLGAAFTGGVKASASGPVLSVAGRLRPMPYSVESPVARRNAAAILLGSAMSRHTRFCLSSDRWIVAIGEIAVESPLTPKRLVAAAIRLALELEPYVRLLGDYADPRPVTGRAESSRKFATARPRG
jgi:hypothetical protein